MAGPASGETLLEHTGERLHEPGVKRHASSGGRRLETRFQALGKSQRDASVEGLVGGVRVGRAVVGDVDEFGITAGYSDLDPASLQLGR
jgi:hypothetical protein